MDNLEVSVEVLKLIISEESLKDLDLESRKNVVINTLQEINEIVLQFRPITGKGGKSTIGAVSQAATEALGGTIGTGADPGSEPAG